MRIVNKNYILKGSVNTNIVLISDIHYYNKKDIKHLNKVLERIKKIKPSYICISGDLTDISYIDDEKYLIDWLKKLSKICKVIISIGNHELYIRKEVNIYGINYTLFDKIEAIKNVYVLDNKSVILDGINFIGITLPIDYYYNAKKSIDDDKYFKSIEGNKKYYNILLCHSPININNSELLKEKNIDLVLCGHMHGGMVPRIFRKFIKNIGFISPEKTLFPKIAYGHILKDNTNILISSGITVVSHINRFRLLKELFSSEIVDIKIKM
ncbi:MAG: metallophosphoesterase [Bacilli bacterium]|nr:metallophosphoesterase [Bacilli bacterium]